MSAGLEETLYCHKVGQACELCIVCICNLRMLNNTLVIDKGPIGAGSSAPLRWDNDRKCKLNLFKPHYQLFWRKLSPRGPSAQVKLGSRELRGDPSISQPRPASPTISLSPQQVLNSPRILANTDQKLAQPKIVIRLATMEQDYQFAELWREAFTIYKKRTGRDLLLAISKYPSLQSVEGLQRMIEQTDKNFNAFRHRHALWDYLSRYEACTAVRRAYTSRDFTYVIHSW